MCPRLGRKQNAGCLLGFLRSIQRKNPTKIIAVSKRGVGLSGFLFIFECKTLFVQTGLRIAWVAYCFAMRCVCKALLKSNRKKQKQKQHTKFDNKQDEEYLEEGEEEW